MAATDPPGDPIHRSRVLRCASDGLRRHATLLRATSDQLRADSRSLRIQIRQLLPVRKRRRSAWRFVVRQVTYF